MWLSAFDHKPMRPDTGWATLNLGAADANFEIVPLMRRGRSISYPVDRGALAVFELPEHQVIFQAVGADGQVVAIRLQIEKDTGALIDAAGQSLEADADLAIGKVRDVGRDHIGKVGVSLHAIEKLSVALAIERARLVGNAC